MTLLERNSDQVLYEVLEIGPEWTKLRNTVTKVCGLVHNPVIEMKFKIPVALNLLVEQNREVLTLINDLNLAVIR